MQKCYVTANPNGLEGVISQVTTVYNSIDKALAFLTTKTKWQQERLYIRLVGLDGKDAGKAPTYEVMKHKEV